MTLVENDALRLASDSKSGGKIGGVLLHHAQKVALHGRVVKRVEHVLRRSCSPIIAPGLAHGDGAHVRYD